MGAGKPADGADRTGGPAFNELMAREIMPDAVKAAVRARRNQAAAERLETFGARVAAAPTHARHAPLARCAALLGTRDPEETFGEALAAVPTLPPSERARTECTRQRSSPRT